MIAKLHLRLKGLGNVPSFKNRKTLGRNPLTGRASIRTSEREREWMERAIHSLELQLRSCIPTTEQGTWTGESLPSLIAWSKSLDDSWRWIPELNLKGKKVPLGEEGVIIEIEEINNENTLPSNSGSIELGSPGSGAENGRSGLE